MELKLKALPCLALMAGIGLMNTQCSKDESEDSDLKIRNGRQVAENASGPDRLSTVGISSGCTGTVIAENLILTAGHCLSNGAMSVVFRTNMYAQGTGAVIPVERKVVHAQYKPTGPYIVPYDIAMLKLSKNIPANYKPVKLLPASQPLRSGEAVLQAGYGETLQRGGGAFGTLRSVNNTYSGRGSYGRVIVANRNFTGTCAGDSGGPLFVNRNNEWYVAGALSGGQESAQYGCHGGGTYTGVAEFHSWLVKAAQNLTGKANPFPEGSTATQPGTPTQPAVLSFGPFGANENKLLTTLNSTEGKYVNFKIELDTESHAQCEFDHVLIQDAAGYSRKLCGKGTWNAKNFVTPVKVTFVSDPLEHSRSVKISAINYYDAVAQGQQSSASDVSEAIPEEEAQEFKEEP
ncbi:trypsin-like serine protease [Oligoflexus tunisiensis]|uniref:trypsin-like serine protease n=1 Tax=Oligoflexus tunisiensis TaxID=708132 RepID=UPI00159EF628|nr:trypsin-like serine protease [Oligoflexus tunisiensis]